jgi:hypothetical protein
MGLEDLEVHHETRAKFIRSARVNPPLLAVIASPSPQRTIEGWRYDEDHRLPASEGPEELDTHLFDDYEAR